MTARGLAGRIALVVVAVLAVLAPLEAVLRARPTLLGQAFANGARSRYHNGPGGIYYNDRRLRMDFMLPDHDAVMYYNGYVWRHHTDALGFRNETLHIPADVMLLGDSVVYGHGVDFEHTLGAYLEGRSRLRVINLGRQGDCTFQQAYLITEYLPVFKPRFVVHVFSPNDIRDLYAYLSDDAMRAFLAQPIERLTFPARTDPRTVAAVREPGRDRRPLLKRLWKDLYVMKMLRWLGDRYQRWRSVAHADPPPERRFDVPDVTADPRSLGWRYTEHALAYMKRVAEQGGARLITTTIASGRTQEVLREVTSRLGIDFIDPAPLFAGPSFLPNDGHLSPHGARVLADLIGADLERRR